MKQVDLSIYSQLVLITWQNAEDVAKALTKELQYGRALHFASVQVIIIFIYILKYYFHGIVYSYGTFSRLIEVTRANFSLILMETSEINCI